jgi:membrane protein DedA with SNARE-associated domain
VCRRPGTLRSRTAWPGPKRGTTSGTPGGGGAAGAPPPPPRGGRPFIERVGTRLHIRPEHLARAELFFARHGDKTVLAAPFVIGPRTWASMLAGMSRMPFSRFQLFSAAAGLAWAAVVAGAGYALGSNLPLLEAIVRVIGVGGVVFVVVIVSFLLVAQERAARRR